jgi:TPR repeat protein
LRLLRITTTPVTEEPFDGTEKAAIARLRAMISADPLGGAAGTELRDPRKLGLRLRTLLTRGPASPRGVPDSDAATPEARYARGWDAQNGPDHDVSEAIYWYGLAARVGDLGAWTQLGLLLVRSHGAVAARDAALLWWIGSQGGAAVASYNLGALYDRSPDVPRDRNLALHWYNVAVSQGNEPAVEALRKLAP